MAGDWLKIEKDTPEKPEIAGLCAILGINPDVAFAKCFRLWRWADSNTADGHVRRVTPEFLDSLVGLPGFTQALLEVGWLRARNDALEFPNFDRHMGQPAKARALAANRKRKERHAECHAARVTETRPEKRREEKSRDPPLPPKGGEGDFPPNLQTDDFAAAWEKWLAHKCEKRKPVTPTQARELLSQLSAAGPAAAAAALKTAIAKDWAGPVLPAGSTNDGPQETLAQRAERQARERDESAQNAEQEAALKVLRGRNGRATP
jgi:hypothetical protein